MGKGITYSTSGKDCPCMGCQKRVVGCHGKCDQYKTWDEKRQAEKLERFRRISILHEADKKKRRRLTITEGEEGRHEQGDPDGAADE